MIPSRIPLLIPVLFLSLFLAHSKDLPAQSLPQMTAPEQNSRFVRFTENRGQVIDTRGAVRPDILYVTGSRNVQVYLRRTGFSYVYRRISGLRDPAAFVRDPQSSQTMIDSNLSVSLYRMDMELIGANPSAIATPLEPSEGYSNYFLPQCPNGVTGVRSFGQIVYHEVYPGIDLVVRGGTSGIKYEFVVHPGGDPTVIKLGYKGADSLLLRHDGGLELSNPLGRLLEETPRSYLVGNGMGDSIPVASSFQMDGATIGFDVGPFDRSMTLVIDPTLAWSTYYGGTSIEETYGWAGTGWGGGQDLGVDGSHNIVVTGSTLGTDFPVTTGAIQKQNSGGLDAYIIKLSNTGSRIWATYYGSDSTDYGGSVAIDSSNNIFLSGLTRGPNFPLSSNAFQRSFGGGAVDGFLVKFDSNGTRLWGTFYGGSGQEWGGQVATDLAGNVIMAGSSYSAGLATPGAFQTTYAGNSDSYMVKFNGNGVRLWATYCGGSGREHFNTGVCTDRGGNVYIAGTTSSTNFPTSQNCYQPSVAGDFDGYLAKFSPSGSRLWTTCLGGSTTEYSSSLTVDLDSNVYVSGYTASNDFPVTSGAFQTRFDEGTGQWESFVMKFGPTGNLRWSTYYGGPGINWLFGICTDPFRDVVLTGYTTSTSFPVTSTAFQTTLSGMYDAVVVKLDSTGSRVWATYFGGSNYEWGSGIVVDSNSVVFAGTTYSSDFPVSSGAFQSSNAGDYDAYVAKICDFRVNISRDGPTTLCPGDSLSLRVPLGFNSYRWSTGEITPSITVKQAGKYWVMATRGTCTSSSDTIRVTVYPTVRPKLNRIGNASFCVGDSLILEVPPGYRSQIWSNGEVKGRIAVRQSGSYFAVVTDTNGCRTISDTVRVIVAPRPVPAITVNGPKTICKGDSVELDAGPGYSGYLWSTLQTTRTIMVSTAGLYSVRVTNAAGCSETSPAVAINQFSNPPVKVIPLSSTSLCNGDSVILDGGSGLKGYLWSTGETTRQITVRQAGRYSFRYELQQGCRGFSDTVEVVVNPRPSPTINGPISICANGLASYSVTERPGTLYNWSVSGGGGAIQSGTNLPEISIRWGSVGTGHVHVQVVDQATACRADTDLTVAIGTGIIPTITSNRSGKLCTGDSVQLDAGPGYASYDWTTGEKQRRIVVTTPGNYAVTVSDGTGCNGTSLPFTVSHNPDPTPVIAIVGGTGLCPGGTVALDAGPGFASYRWSSGQSVRLATIATPGTYSVTVTDSAGCMGTSQPFVVQMQQPPQPEISGAEWACINSRKFYSVAGSSGDSYLWRVSPEGTIIAGQGTPNVRILWTVAGAGTVDLVQTSAATGCSGTARTFRVDVGTSLNPTVTWAGTMTLCQGDSVELDAPAGFESYLWSTGDTTPRLIVRTAGIYGVTVSDGECHGATPEVSVVVLQRPPVPVITAVEDTLFASPAPAYRWRRDGADIPGANASRIIPDAAGDYTVLAVDTTGCTSESSPYHIFDRIPHEVLLDTVSARAGERLTLTMRAAPPILPGEGIRGYHIRLGIDPLALFPIGLDSAGSGERLLFSVAADGSINVDRPDTSAPFAGSELFRVVMQGLVTGQPVNTVEITEAMLGDRHATFKGGGLVLLSGCDIGTGFGVDKAVAILSIRPNPVSTGALIAYSAPSGAVPMLVVTDIAGRGVIRRQLPPGTGSQQEVLVETGDLPSGLYRFELHDRAERSVIPVMIVK